VHREVVRPSGTSFKSERAPGEQTSEFLASTDLWSRFTGIRAGPDGALYITDMYRLVIEHPKWIPDAWQKQLGDVRAGDNAGRIYRVKRRGAALRPVPRLDRADTAGLVAALASPSGVVRDLAQQQLFWRNDVAAVPALERLAADATLPQARVQALWSLNLLGRLTPAAVERALRDPHPGVRRHAVRLSEGFAATTPTLLAPVAALADDADAMVRMQVSYTLGEWKAPAAGVALARLLRATNDRYLRAAAMSSALSHADTLISELSAGGRGDDPLVIEIATVTENAKALAALLTGLAEPLGRDGQRSQLATLGLLLDWLQRNNKTLAQLQATGGEPMRRALDAAEQVFVSARKLAIDERAPASDRVAAAKVLGRGRGQQNEDIEVLAKLLTPATPVEVQLAAVASLGRINRTVVPERLLAGWPGYSTAVRGAVLDLVTSRPAWTHVLLDRVEADRTMLAQIDASRRAALTQQSNAKLAERAAAVFHTGMDADRQKVIDRYAAALPALQGDAQRGAKVFAAACSACHSFGQTPGRPVGPDLAVVKDRTAPYLLTHILDPNRAVEDRYVFYTVSTQDGRAVAGMLTGEAGGSLTLVGLDGVEQTILRSEIRALTSSGRSLMPDGLEGAVNEQAMADLIAFLAGAGR
jgi:putative heme-binding domain-containing protein